MIFEDSASLAAVEFALYAIIYNLATYTNTASDTGEQYELTKALPVIIAGAVVGLIVYYLGGDIHGTDVTVLALALIVAFDQLKSAAITIYQTARDVSYYDGVNQHEAYVAAFMKILPHINASAKTIRETSKTFTDSIERSEGPPPELITTPAGTDSEPDPEPDPEPIEADPGADPETQPENGEGAQPAYGDDNGG